jgi:zinc transport system ATP-binding protein
MSIVECNALAIGYENKQVVENLTFSINYGDYLCVLGENGSGKSTLMRTILGLHKPLSGSISFSGSLKRGEIGYLPQQTAAQKDFPASVFEVVLSGTINKEGMLPFYTRKQKELAEHNLELLGISGISKQCYRELSGGQQQRVLLARALCASSKLLVLDEPVTGLDPQATEDMYSIIKELNSSGVTILMVTHDVESAVKYASHVLHLSRRPKFFGTVDAYLESDAYKSAVRGGRPI